MALLFRRKDAHSATLLLLLVTCCILQLLPSSMAWVPQRTPFSLVHQRILLRESKTTLAATAEDMSDVGFVLLAGGTGSRMKASMPKQFLTLRESPVLHHSLHLFLERLPEYLKQEGKEGPAMVVLVMDPMYQPDYQPIVDKYKGRLAFANPGKERQGSVENGLAKLVELAGSSCEYVAVHDSARPLVTIDEICGVVADAKEYGAAVLGVPCKATIKESIDGVLVSRTIPRSTLWEVHTPQVIKIPTLLRGFAKVEAEQLEVTDDVSIVEALGEPVKLTLGEYTNLKITTPEDMDVANAILEERKQSPIKLLA
uniref:2-C-methyl-D-erythritol 4-phosphate cytidylyltransferase, chloroplastic n=1 Tax=Attheya septentrionalis TaxID=420275 RepID=A0A7S2XKF1_9STRA|mmetsp:Transcript_14358/g.26097  ORF Transcript_14358/g.26097 Transcript_14358/m.26097 type:complete len:313 (+) Transcript_14358:159-1097(+)|eukprot:CAMPEP_0198280072 /NCGR_PEP_ID=MMETSP1449-20131203/234_1 /TAXON_ID=420275 /ORGANISM="Attheya septentrionalis, Strain CCMP2084" /LENGTH=312 /DNA_ID=CAMNT_0043975339 /DNA_START=140 /DNA_END=1078 /DNA_ORIENTATION=+